MYTNYNYYLNVVMVTTDESTSVVDAVWSSSKTRSSKLTSAKKTVDPGMLLPYVEYRCTHTGNIFKCGNGHYRREY